MGLTQGTQIEYLFYKANHKTNSLLFDFLSINVKQNNHTFQF